MPTYEYECRNCKEHFDIFQNITAPPLKICPKCKGEIVRLIGRGSGIIFKGSGFYATDYKKSEKSKNVAACPLDKGGEGCKTCPAKESA